jgi:hypothetical protein
MRILTAAFLLACLGLRAEEARTPGVPDDLQARKLRAAQAHRERVVVLDFYRAIYAVSSAHAKDPFSAASAFARNGMHEAVLAWILKTQKDLTAPEVDGILARREGVLREVSYRDLTCLFVKARSWVRVDGKTWVPAPLTPEQVDGVWKKAPASQRRDALAASYVSLVGKQVKTLTTSCRACDGRPRCTDNQLGRIISTREDFLPMNCTCRRCLGVGVVVTLRYR